MGLGLVIAIAFTQQTLIYAQSFSQLQLHHVTLSVSDVDLVSQWYADILGFNIRGSLYPYPS
ncbi:MAG: VOC family protein, partial [Hydrococcus sp. CSU_1_8]|nr:VOC family protein [Hydrococcus sp. CSU_1_8]